MSERLTQILRAGKLVGTGFIGTREQIKQEAAPVLEDVEEKWREHRRRRALNGAIVVEAESDAGAAAPPQSVPATVSPAPPGAIIVRRRGEGPP
jgi:hypothetical protein